ncbi:Tn3 family transposase [Streptomyces sp. NPDC092903]|uniref:Tn3 family transposase n=1 Tax=Streptomyces sp. NPDC092903 TaxID=3366017 RepID=UPI0037FD12A3
METAHEVGRVIRIVQLLRYLTDTPLRPRVTAATNKVESFNRFSQWIGFGNRGAPSFSPARRATRAHGGSRPLRRPIEWSGGFVRITSVFEGMRGEPDARPGPAAPGSLGRAVHITTAWSSHAYAYPCRSRRLRGRTALAGFVALAPAAHADGQTCSQKMAEAGLDLDQAAACKSTAADEGNSARPRTTGSSRCRTSSTTSPSSPAVAPSAADPTPATHPASGTSPRSFPHHRTRSTR